MYKLESIHMALSMVKSVSIYICKNEMLALQIKCKMEIRLFQCNIMLYP